MQQQQQLPASGPAPQAQGGGGAVAPTTTVKVCDLRPSATSAVNTTFIILEKGPPARLIDGGPMVCVALVADSTAAVHLQLWGNECEAFQPSDIIRLTNGLFSYHKNNMVLRAGKKGSMEKIGEFTMVFVENPNMSRVQWLQDPSNSKLLIPVGLNQSSPPVGAVGAGIGALLNSPRVGMIHQDRA